MSYNASQLCVVFRSGKSETFIVETKPNKYKQIIELNPKPLLNIAVVIKRLLWNL